MSESPQETIERLTALNNELAQLVKRGSDRLQESARELLAQGWDAGVAGQMLADGHNSSTIQKELETNPYRQPIDLPGITEEP